MSDLPDVCTEPQGDTTMVIANRKARKLFNKHFERPRPQWNKINPDCGSCFTSPEYKVLPLEGDCTAVLSAMLCEAHRAGLSAAFICARCDKLHVVDDERAKKLWFDAVAGSENALPPPGTVQ
jgi:hypothetical protein